MTSADPLAHERFRTIVSDVLGNLDDAEPYENAAEAVVDAFPEAHFEYRTNAAGVRLRKAVVESGWEVDLNPDGPRTCPKCGGWTSSGGALADHLKVVHEPVVTSQTDAQTGLRAAPWHP